MSLSRENQRSGQSVPALRVGQPFNSFALFTGIFIPDVLVRCPIISAGAKLAYARLARYAGQHGQCYPAVEHAGRGDRPGAQASSAVPRGVRARTPDSPGDAVLAGRAQTSNGFEFLWHEMFQEGVTDVLHGRGCQIRHPTGCHICHPKRVRLKRVRVKRQTPT